jgi:hypothetical protein
MPGFLVDRHPRKDVGGGRGLGVTPMLYVLYGMSTKHKLFDE